MKKEQILLVVGVGVAALLVALRPTYEPVGAATLGEGADVGSRNAAAARIREGLGDWPGGRNAFLEYRTEERKPREDLAPPPASSVPFLLPVPYPGSGPATWTLYRSALGPLQRPAATAGTEETVADAGTDANLTPEQLAQKLANEDKDRAEKAAQKRRDHAARLVRKDSSEQICRITPLGTLEGQESWKLLEQWPNVTFRVDELNQDGASVRGSYVITPAEIADRYQTVRLEKSLENEYHEERIRRNVRKGDKPSNVEFAQWLRSNLRATYGVAAVRLALPHLREALTVGPDAALTRLLGDVCREAYDPEAEIKAYLDHLVGTRANDAPVLASLADAYERSGALHAARDTFQRAAAAGDVESRIRAAVLMIRLADRASDLDASYEELQKVVVATGGGTKARAYANQAWIRLLQGRVDDAAALCGQARTDGTGEWWVWMLQGCVQYAKGQFAEAEKSFASAAPLEPHGGTRARSNRGFALLALGKAPEAVAEFEACLKNDPLNFVDPLIGLGEAHQRWGEQDRAADYFQTARMRHPSHPWILARLASLRLKDGRGDQSLELLRGSDGSPGLLQLAPELVDGLRVAGLAAASLETPEHAAALRFLGRAREKEPKNADLLYDQARSLWAARRVEDAIAVLEKETDATNGFAKNDARCLALLAYCLYDADRPADDVYTVVNRTTRALQANWTATWTQEFVESVRRWDSTRIVRDEFTRAASSNVGFGWTETELPGTGANVGVDGQACVISGKAMASDDRNKQFGIVRSEDLGRFVAAEATFKAGTGYEFVWHVYVGSLSAKDAAGGRRGAQGSEFGLGRDRNGRMCWFIYPAGGQQSATRLLLEPVKDADGKERMWPDDGAAHTVRIERTDEKKGIYRVLFDGQEIPAPEVLEMSTLAATRGRTMSIAFHVDGDAGVQFDVAVDRVEIEKLSAR